MPTTWKSAVLTRGAVLPIACLALAALFTIAARGSAASAPANATHRPTIVLVHGDWADGSSWSRVIPRLQGRGFTVVAPPNLLRGPVTDGAYLSDYLHSITGPIVLVAHSYGGFVITNAARGNPNVKALVYIDSFLPARGETAGALAAAWGSCVDQSALNPVPYHGGVDLYLRRTRTRRTRGTTSASRTGFRTERPTCSSRRSGPRPSPSSPKHRDVPRGSRFPPGR